MITNMIIAFYFIIVSYRTKHVDLFVPPNIIIHKEIKISD